MLPAELRTAALSFVLLGALLVASPLRGQSPADSLPGIPGVESRLDDLEGAERQRDDGDTVSAGRPAEGAPLPVPEKPPVHEFRLSLAASAFTWEEEARADDGLLASFELERDIASFLAVRAGLGYGSSDFRVPGENAPQGGIDGPSAEVEVADMRLYLPEVNVLFQPAWGRLEASRFRPYALVGFGALVTDPRQEGLSTRSQNAFGYGAGARLRLASRLGVRAEVERYLIKLEDPFSVTERESRSVHNTRFGGSLTYAF
jgi:hypothetical protein